MPVDPFTIAMLAGSGLGAAQGIANVFSNNPSQKLNRERLDELLALQRSGGLGLTGVDQRVMAQQAVAPTQRAATEATRRAEQLAAASGNSSGGQLAAQQMKQAEVVGDAVSRATQQIALANQQKKNQQLAEIEARTAQKSAYTADDINSAFGAAAQTAVPIGMAAGGPPGMTQLGGLFGQEFQGISLPPDEMGQLLELIGKDPAALERLKAALSTGA